MSEQKKVGRPVSKNPRTKVVQVRFTEEHYKLIEECADMAGLTISAFIRGNVLSGALKSVLK